MTPLARALAAVVLVLTGLGLTGLGTGPARAEEMIGTWLTQNRDAHIRLARCGAAICGTVIWLRDAVDPQTGAAPVDDKNPDASLRSRKIIGIRIFAMEDKGRGFEGPIYNSDDGQTYRGRLSPRGENEVEVQGCSGNLCGSEVWTRVADAPAPPKRR